MEMTLNTVLHLGLAISGLLLLVKVGTFVGKRFGIPAVVAEILLGILIGPSILGATFPAWSGWLFPVTGQAGQIMSALTQWAMLLLLFCRGYGSGFDHVENGKS